MEIKDLKELLACESKLMSKIILLDFIFQNVFMIISQKKVMF